MNNGHATNMQRDVLVLNLEKQFTELVRERCGSAVADCSERELYYALLALCRELLKVTERNAG